MATHTLLTAAGIVQQALTPVFLLSGIAALLNVFAARLGRVADQADAMARAAGDADRDARMRMLKRRSVALDVAVVLAALAGSLTCGSVLFLFLGAVQESGGAGVLFLLFGGAIVLTMGALAAFVVEMLLATHGVRKVVESSVGK